MKKAGIVGLFLLSTPFIFSLTLDVRTHLLEQHKFLAIRSGASYYLLSNDYTLLEVSEDYAVWLKDYNRYKKGNRYYVEFSINITEPTMLEEKEALAEERLEFSYDPGHIESIAIDQSFLEYLKEKLRFLSDSAKAEATIGGELAYKAIDRLVRRLEK